MADRSGELPIHFFTLVLNGEPFIRYHLERFKKLTCAWHWHIIEGVADLKHDTAWSLHYGASVPPDVAKDGRSVDGTAEYLDEIARENPGQITLYRAPDGRRWEGKLEMVNAPLPNLPADCLLWEVDADELWTVEQLTKMRGLFEANPERTAAVFYCWYFVGPKLVIDRRRRYDEIEWRRVWRFRRAAGAAVGLGDPRWAAHEPPVLAVPILGTDKGHDVAMQKPFTPAEMEAQGLVFQHFAYVIERQLEFKEKYYGYKGITEQWRRLQAAKKFPVPLKSFFNWPWVSAGAMVEPAEVCGVASLAQERGGRWVFDDAPQPPRVQINPNAVMGAGGTAGAKRGILYVKWGPDDRVLERSIRSVRAIHPELPIHIHRLPDNATLLDKAAMQTFTPFEETLFLDVDTIVIDRLDFGFEMGVRHGLACAICECPWARRYGGIQGDLVEYNTGVLFFTAKSRPIFDAWTAHVRTVDSSIVFYNAQNQLAKMPFNDQAGFALAVAGAEVPPFILPFNWNFRPIWQRAWFGPIKIWHDYSEPPADLVSFCQKQARADAVIQYVKFNVGQ